MSRRTRGRALIINILFSSSQQQRHGSRADYANISQCLKDLGFDLVKTEQQLTDLTAQVHLQYLVIVRLSPVLVCHISRLDILLTKKLDFRTNKNHFTVFLQNNSLTIIKNYM